MAYTSNPYAPKARKLATNLVKGGKTKSEVARMYGVHRSTIGKWMRKATKHSCEHIQTLSSSPHTHPNQLPPHIIQKIVEMRKKTNRCAQVLHTMLEEEGITVSLSSIKRTLKRQGLIRKRRSHIKLHTRFKRPMADTAGALVQMDTIHFVTSNYKRFYIYAVIDTYSRIGYLEYSPRISTQISSDIVTRALKYFTFKATVVQTDNGSEFGSFLVSSLKRKRIRLRHTRVRKPNDNAHVERFIRTVQEECFDGALPNEKTIQRRLTEYTHFYNTQRIHLGIQCKKPVEMLPRC